MRTATLEGLGTLLTKKEYNCENGVVCRLSPASANWQGIGRHATAWV